MISTLGRIAAATVVAAGITAGLAGTANAAEPGEHAQFICPTGSFPAYNRTAEIAPVYEFPGDGEVFTSVAPNAQFCVDGNTAGGPGGTYQHFTADGTGGLSDGWINLRFVSTT